MCGVADFSQRNASLSMAAGSRPAHACARISILSYGAFSDVI